MPRKPITQEDVVREIDRLTREARQRPGLFRLRVSLTAAYVYWILFGIPLSFLIIGLVWFPLLIVGIGVAIASTTALVQQLRVAFEPPKGLVLTPGMAPELFRVIESVRAELQAPPVDAVVLTIDFNASMSEAPRHVFFGWKSYLSIGFPVALALGPQHFRALIAHELAHLANSHSRATIHLLRVRAAAMRLFNGFAQRRGLFPLLFNRLLAKYIPRLDACIFVLGREFESDCDTMAARASSARDVAELLLRLSVLGSLGAVQYWTEIWRHVGQSAAPPSQIYEGLNAALHAPVELAKLVDYLLGALDRPTGPLDSHPSLAQRLAGLGFSKSAVELAAWLQVPATPAVDSLFPDNRDAIFSQMDRIWADASAQNWTTQHTRIAALVQTRSRLGDKAGSAPLSLNEMWELATAVDQLEGTARALPQLEALVQVAPDFLPASERLGMYWLAEGDARGIPLVERAIEENLNFRVAGYKALAGYYEKLGNQNTAARYRQLTAAAQSQYDAAMAEGNRLAVKATLLASGLSKEILDRIVDAASTFPELDRLYLVRKAVQLFPEFPCYIVVANLKVDWRHPFRKNPQFLLRLMTAMRTAQLPPRTHFYVNLRSLRLRYRISRVPGGEVYRSSK